MKLLWKAKMDNHFWKELMWNDTSTLTNLIIADIPTKKGRTSKITEETDSINTIKLDFYFNSISNDNILHTLTANCSKWNING